MEEFFTNSYVGTAGPWVLVTLFVIALLRGFVVPRSVLLDVRSDRDARLAELTREKELREANLIQEREDWKEAFFNSEQSRRIGLEQIAELTELARTGTAVMRNLPMIPSPGMEEPHGSPPS